MTTIFAVLALLEQLSNIVIVVAIVLLVAAAVMHISVILKEKKFKRERKKALDKINANREC